MVCYHQCQFCKVVYDHNGKCIDPFYDGFVKMRQIEGGFKLEVVTYRDKCNHHRVPQFPELFDIFLSCKL